MAPTGKLSLPQLVLRTPSSREEKRRGFKSRPDHKRGGAIK